MYHYVQSANINGFANSVSGSKSYHDIKWFFYAKP